ncbi:hypothetical protein [Terricaulis sp.]|uniref:hypothetical protein n=1 Tax=Terricaulis sp. TaxID=2768686 RepID=UPI003782D22E
MKAAWKYIVYLDDDGDEAIATFPTSTVHAEYARRHGITSLRLVSAGFVTSDKECFGHSSSLHLESRPKHDTALLRDV